MLVEGSRAPSPRYGAYALAKCHVNRDFDMEYVRC